MADISKTTSFKYFFLNWILWFVFYWSLFTEGSCWQKNQHWFRILDNCFTLSKWQSITWTNFDLRYYKGSLGHNEWTYQLIVPRYTIWRQRSRSTLAQVMACCLTAPSHYLNQFWLIISKVQWHSSEGNFNHREKPQPLITKISLKITFLKFH